MSIAKELTPRLMQVAQQVPECETCADIGCDHAQVSIYLASSGRVKKMLAADVNQGPLSRAKAAVSQAGLDEHISCVRTDGLEGISPQDSVVIAGMGGDLIADILAKAEWTCKEGVTLVLQPMTAAERLREFLSHSGYEILRESYVYAREKLYVIITATAGEGRIRDESELYISRAGQAHPLACDYAERLVHKLSLEISGLMRAECPDDEEIAHRRDIVSALQRRFNI